MDQLYNTFLNNSNNYIKMILNNNNFLEKLNVLMLK